ncbi:MAG: family 20 glycosylhydrolase [Opitutus sp.]
MKPPLDLVPVPAELQLGTGRLPVTAAFSVSVVGAKDARLQAGVERALKRWSTRTGLSLNPKSVAADAATLVIEAAGPGRPLPALEENESYSLDVSTRQARLRAPTTVGALHGLETLLQLLAKDADGFYVPVVTIRDQPRFAWRGLLIDVARHWQPIEVIKRNLDAMAVVKLNVLHLHLTEDQGFRIESRTHPELHTQGSDGQLFTQAQIREIIAYAQERGIRVVPEFDIPGHVTSWVVSHPELASKPGPYKIERQWGVCDPVLDPTNEQVYVLLDDFLGEMAQLFPDQYLHIGGDENNGVHWTANPKLQAFIKEHNLKDNEGLQAYFNRKVSTILTLHGRRLVGWDEILHPDLPKNSVIHSWRGPTALAEAATRGYSGILSNGYYIDLNQPASEHYLVDPLPADTTLTTEEQRRILGGEATMWGEWVTPDNIDTRIWPRTAAIAERLWSPRDVRDVSEMYRRLAVVDLRLQEVGTQQGNWPRFKLPGVENKSAMADALRTLAASVEPVRAYRRGGLQPEVNQLTPLDELADWSRADSASARAFNEATQQWLFGSGEWNSKTAEPLVRQLTLWRDAGELAAKAPVVATRISEARPGVARNLAQLGRAGLELVTALTSGKPLPADRQKAVQELLTTAAVPTAAAVEFPFLNSLRELGAAAAAPAERTTLPQAAWRTKIESAAQPAERPHRS